MKTDHHLEARNKSRLAVFWFLDSAIEKPEQSLIAICSLAFSPLEKFYCASRRCPLLLCHTCQAGLSAAPASVTEYRLKLSICGQLTLLVILFIAQQLFMHTPFSHPLSCSVNGIAKHLAPVWINQLCLCTFLVGDLVLFVKYHSRMK